MNNFSENILAVKNRTFYQFEQWPQLTVDNCESVEAELLPNASQHPCPPDIALQVDASLAQLGGFVML